MTKLLFSLTLIISGLVLGYLWQLWLRRANREATDRITILRKTLQKIGLLFFMPISFITAVWVVALTDVRLFLLPFIGAFALLSGGVLGLLGAQWLRMDGIGRGTMYCCGSFTNIGSIGALVAFIFLGEAGFGLIAMYKMFEETIYYTIGFPVARYLQDRNRPVSVGARLREVSGDPFVRMAVLAFVCGITLNLSGLPRPAVFAAMNSFFVPAGTFVLLLSIGLGMRFSSIIDHLRPAIFIGAIKFLLVPLVTVSLAWLLGLGDIGDGLPLKVVLVASSMPVAFTALVAASIYDLDLDLANSCWLFTTGALVLTLPLLVVLLGHF